MAVLSSDEAATLAITDFIFHVVHIDSGPILFDATPWKKYNDFFLARVRDTLGGNSFEFLSKSGRVRSILHHISENPESFLDQSKVLAQHFQQFTSGVVAPGVMILMKLASEESELFAIIKYEHERVITYKKAEDSNTAILDEIKQSFTESPRAMQKSALVKLTGDGGFLAVKDRSYPKNISQYMKGFLEVKRSNTESEMTAALKDVAIAVSKKHKSILPDEVTKNIRTRCFEYAKNTEQFDESSFFSQIFGPSANEEVRKSFNSEMRKHFEEGESFEIDKTAIPKPRGKNIRTIEGVFLKYPDDAAGTVEFTSLSDNRTQIIVTTSRFFEE